MLLVFQIPISDLRLFLEENTSKLRIPTWPIPNPNTDFVRSFGSIERRANGGLSGWVGENVLCNARKAITFEPRKSTRPVLDDDSIHVSSDQEPFFDFNVIFRRFYHDGVAMGKFEIGLKIDLYNLPRKPSPKVLKQLLKSILNLNVQIQNPLEKGKTVCPLHDAGRHLARLYHWSSYDLNDSSYKAQKNWVISHCEAILFLVNDSGYHELPKRFARMNQDIPTSEEFIGTLSHHRLLHNRELIRTWKYEKLDFAYTDKNDVFHSYLTEEQVQARQLRIFLLRLHAQKQSLNSILRNVSRGRINPKRGTDASAKLQNYLNDSIKNIRTLRKNSLSLADTNLAAFARVIEDDMTPGEFDTLINVLESLDLRKNIIQKTKTEVSLNVDRKNIKKILKSYFNIVELKEILFDLNIDHEEFSTKKSEMIMDFILYMESRDQFDVIIDWLNENRPDVFDD